MSTPRTPAALLLLVCLTAACEDPPKAVPETEPAKPLKQDVSAARAPVGPPSLVIDSIGPKVGSERINLQYPDGKQKLGEELEKNKSAFENQDVRLEIDRKAKPEWVSLYFDALGKIGISKVLVRTETRKEFPSELGFTPEARLGSPASCSVVAMILADRGTAVWKLGGGVAGKRPKGMAGPDLTMTGDSVERLGKACQQGNALFVAGAEGIEWGLVYDLAASTTTLESARFDTRVLLSKTPVPGRKVAL